LVNGLIRVTGGIVKGRRLKGPKGRDFRPATGQVKEFIFSFIGADIQEARCLDLFSGTGAIGIEALSRGAKWVDFIEKAYSQATLIRENLEMCGFLSSSRITRGDVFSVINGMIPGSYDYIFADPPFRKSLRHRIVTVVDHRKVLDKGGFLILEHEKHDEDSGGHGLSCIRQKRFGHCMVSIYV
jgi:16S rRNA (guanine(966)-N(2))-methyltransferase RsmD